MSRPLVFSLAFGLFSLALAQPTTSAAAPAAPTIPVKAEPVFEVVPALSKTPVRQFDAPQWVIDPAKTYRATLHTAQGNITLELYAQAAPKAVNNFVFLALHHFYDGTRFHRVIDGFMAQGGDPNSADLTKVNTWGQGGPGYDFFVELDPKLKFDSAGVLGMARSQSYFSQGSQFFITLAPAEFLNEQYTVFGKVVSGLDILNKLTKTMDGQNKPLPDAKADVLTGVDISVSR